MSEYDHIRPYLDSEVNDALQAIGGHAIMKALLAFSLPGLSEEKQKEQLLKCESIYDFQIDIIYKGIQNILMQTSEGLTTNGFEKLEKGQPYLFISNHRDIILDTSLLNVALYDNDLVMTASAIGDNLVQKPILLELSKLNRNFLVQRSLSPREMLLSSRLMSKYIRKNLSEDNRSVWLAQREGRTKDGHDVTQQGVLKMLALGCEKGEDVLDYFKEIKIVPVAISYEFDPTDKIKMPELMAKYYEKEYIKSSNEDFNSILRGLTGQKKRIHIEVGDVLDQELNEIKSMELPQNKQLQELSQVIDQKIYENYKLWPSKYIAYDLLNQTDKYKGFYTEKEKRQFERRIDRRVEPYNHIALKNFLLMYANPVINKEQLQGE
ncbi:MAG: 1-acyl-sn-glycerol-3-phosphate acyltransferase [Flavobacteriaceae bacterium]|nr:1-acyl-sn-glycerol-3-phosphate acyltransferase [Flavobacteriaceae bacterium]